MKSTSSLYRHYIKDRLWEIDIFFKNMQQNEQPVFSLSIPLVRYHRRTGGGGGLVNTATVEPAKHYDVQLLSSEIRV